MSPRTFPPSPRSTGGGTYAGIGPEHADMQLAEIFLHDRVLP